MGGVIAILIILTFVFIIIGIPIYISLMFTGLLSLAALASSTATPLATLVIPQSIFNGIGSLPLLAIPFFMLAGEIMNRGKITEKLIKFATRIPIFMYLSDYRECCLKDVITQLEPKLFKKVTGLDTNDFELLVSLGLFNDALMNDAVYKFKRYEDASLTYTGIDRYEDENKGGWDTVISSEDYQRLFAMQQESILDFAAAIMPDIMPQPVVEEVTKADNVSTVIEERPVEAGYSDIEVGTVVWHKAFGEGIVSDIYDDIIEVAFGNVKKKFQFPGAFMQGFLSL